MAEIPLIEQWFAKIGDSLPSSMLPQHAERSGRSRRRISCSASLDRSSCPSSRDPRFASPSISMIPGSSACSMSDATSCRK